MACDKQKQWFTQNPAKLKLSSLRTANKLSVQTAGKIIKRNWSEKFTLFAKKKPTSKCENYLCQHQPPAKFYYKIALQKVDPHA